MKYVQDMVSIKGHIEGLSDRDAKRVLKKIKAALIRVFGDMHELVLLGMPCDSELMYDMGYIRDFGRHRRLLYPRVMNMMNRFRDDRDVIRTLYNVLQSCL